jgi:phage shock protein PspC (stress-responsive transcriptional regulator)
MTNIDTEPGPLPPPLPAPIEPAERRWARSDDRVVLGVAGGLARGLAIDPLFVRIAFVVLALFSGVGLLIYIAGFLLLADSPTSAPPGIIRRIVGIAAVIASARWLVRGDAHLPDAGWVVAIGLLGIAVALWRGRDTHTEAPPVESPITLDTERSASRWSTWTAQRRQRPRPPRSPLGLLGIGAAAVVGALVWLFNSGAGNRGTLAFGWATAVLGATMIVGTFIGRARWLILPAAVTAGAALVAAALNFAGTGLNHHTGDRTEYIGEGTAVAQVYEVGTGDLTLYVQDDTADVTTAGEVGIGSVHVVVPDDARVQVDAAVGIGTIDVFGTTRNGYRRVLHLDNGSSAHVIHLRLRTGVGSINVERYSSRGFFGAVPAPPFTPTTLGLPVRQSFNDGTFVFSDGSIQFADGSRVEADGTYNSTIVSQNPDGSVTLDNGARIDPDGTVHTPGGFVIEPQNPKVGP